MSTIPCSPTKYFLGNQSILPSRLAEISIDQSSMLKSVMSPLDSAFIGTPGNAPAPRSKGNPELSISNVGCNLQTESEEEPLHQAQSCFESDKMFHWFKGDCIGAGAFAKVYLGLNLETWELMAVKQVNRKKIQRSSPSHAEIGLLTPEEAIRIEIELMKDFDDVNIVKFFGIPNDLTSRLRNNGRTDQYFYGIRTRRKCRWIIKQIRPIS
jgi:hypothetical protein